MTTFVRVAEIWVPDADGYLLEFGGGLYDQAPEFGAISRAMCFGRGEGLPGRVWEERRPVILKDLQGGGFQRAAVAKSSGLTCAVAFPIFFDDVLKSVVVLFAGDVRGQSGAIEVWCNDPRVTSDLKLLDGVYGSDDAAFEKASREAMMPRGSGLPGLAWQREGSVYLDGLTDSSRFLRSEEAGATGIRSGLAMPCPVPGDSNFVLAFLSAPSAPIATRVESWVAGADAQSLTQAWTSDASHPATVAPAAAMEAFAGGVARVDEGSSMIALPIVGDGVVTEAMALYF